MDTAKGNEEMTDVEMVDAEKTEEEKVNDHQAKVDKDKDDQAGALISMTQNEKPKLPPSTFSLSLSSNYVIPTMTTPTPSITLPTTEVQATIISVTDPLPIVIQRLSELENKVKELSKVNHSKVIEESIQANTLVFLAQPSSTLVKPSFGSAESLSEYELKKILFDKIDKSHSFMTHDKHQELYDALLNSVCLDEAIASGEVNPDKVLRKRHRDEDQDPPAGSDKKKKRSRKGKDFDSKSVKEPIHEVAIDVEEPILDDVVNDVDQPQDNVALKKDIST
ncbi:hypothetical protein Tco_1170271, partial [Tanacetum coccineum]